MTWLAVCARRYQKVKLNNWSRSYNINVLSMPLALGRAVQLDIIKTRVESAYGFSA
jgi:hypothetical protein